VYNLNYTPTLGVQSQRKIMSGGVQEQKRLNTADLENMLTVQSLGSYSGDYEQVLSPSTYHHVI
jgi:hypothetical protein